MAFCNQGYFWPLTNLALPDAPCTAQLGPNELDLRRPTLGSLRVHERLGKVGGSQWMVKTGDD